MAGVARQLMTALWSHIKPAPYPFGTKVGGACQLPLLQHSSLALPACNLALIQEHRLVKGVQVPAAEAMQ